MKKYINRTIEETVIRLSKSFPVVMITGARQVEKTTLLYHIAGKLGKDIKRVSLDNISLLSCVQLLQQYFEPPVRSPSRAPLCSPVAPSSP